MSEFEDNIRSSHWLHVWGTSESSTLEQLSEELKNFIKGGKKKQFTGDFFLCLKGMPKSTNKKWQQRCTGNPFALMFVDGHTKALCRQVTPE